MLKLIFPGMNMHEVVIVLFSACAFASRLAVLTELYVYHYTGSFLDPTASTVCLALWTILCNTPLLFAEDVIGALKLHNPTQHA